MSNRLNLWLLFASLLFNMNVNADQQQSNQVGSAAYDGSVSVAKPKISKPFSSIPSADPDSYLSQHRRASVSVEQPKGERLESNIEYNVKGSDEQLSLDSALQDAEQYSTLASVSDISKGVNFDGIGNVSGVVPPDANGDVGPNNYVQVVNKAIVVFNKTGSILAGPFSINEIWRGFGGICETNNDGSPIVLYDSMADRWFISQHALAERDFHQCIAVSTTGDPTSSYYLYDFRFGDTFNDSPKFGVWHNAYYMGVNRYQTIGGTFLGASVVAYEREKMLIGAEARQHILSTDALSVNVSSPIPLDIDGIHAPNSNIQQRYIWSDTNSSDKLYIGEYRLDWSDLNNAAFTLSQTLNVASWLEPKNPIQPNGERLDSLGSRPMYRAAYHNLGTSSSVIFNHTVGRAGSREAALRWYELGFNQATGALTINQQGTYAPDVKARWLGSGAMDAKGNIAFGYSRSSVVDYPSIYATIRLEGDSPNSLGTEFSLKDGEGSQFLSGSERWGEFSSMSIDPSDGCSFWYTNQYYKVANDNTSLWSTYISSFKIAGCRSIPSGIISGKVTDAVSSGPIVGAKVSVGGRSTTTNNEGLYSLTLPVGTYQVTASNYGWVARTTSNTSLADQQTRTVDFQLNPANRLTISGTIRDGGAHGWPLYGKLTIQVPGGVLPVYTNPETGAYTVSLVAGIGVKLIASAVDDSYMSSSKDVVPNVANIVEDFSLSINQNCTALGYKFDQPGIIEQFEGAFPPQGWTQMSNTSVEWQRSDATVVGNVTRTSGFGAVIDSNAAGSLGTDTDASLYTEEFTVANLKNTILTFVANHRTRTGADNLDLEIEVDGGAWQSVERLDKGFTLYDGLRDYRVDLASFLTSATRFRLRWRYHNADDEWFASIDNVVLGTPECVTASGDIIVGYVQDENDNDPINGAAIKVNQQIVSFSKATPTDDNLTDGFVYAFSPSNSTLEVSAAGYEPKAVTDADFSLATPILLDAGELEPITRSMTLNVEQGRQLEADLILRNKGMGALNFQLGTMPEIITRSASYFESGSYLFNEANLNDKNTSNILFNNNGLQARALTEPSFVRQFSLNSGAGSYGIGVDRVKTEFWIGETEKDARQFSQLVEYDKQGRRTGVELLTEYSNNSYGAGMAYNGRTGMLWQVEVGGGNCIHEFNPFIEALTGNKICPKLGISQRGLAYDPLSSTYYLGSWNDSRIHQVASDGTTSRSANVNINIAGLAFNPKNGELFVANNISGTRQPGVFDIYVLDTNEDHLPVIGGFNVNLDTSGDGRKDFQIENIGGLDIDCDGNLWAVDQDKNEAIGFSVGITGVCDWQHVPWLSFDIDEGQINAGAQQRIKVKVNGSLLSPGNHKADISVYTNTPDSSTMIPVEVRVSSSASGEVDFVNTEVSVQDGRQVSLRVSRIGGSDLVGRVNYTVVENTAVAGVHFDHTSGTLTWGDGDSSDKTITIQTKDAVLSQPVSFAVLLHSPQNVVLGKNYISVVTVTGTFTAQSQVRMATAIMEVNEDVGSVNVVVERLGSGSAPVTVRYQIDEVNSNGTETLVSSGSLTWGQDNFSSKSIRLDVNDDNTSGNDKLMKVSLSGDSTVDILQSITVVKIDDNDARGAPDNGNNNSNNNSNNSQPVRSSGGGAVNGYILLILILLSCYRCAYLRRLNR